MRRYCLALDLKDDAVLIGEYEAYHRNVWPEIIKHSKTRGLRTWKYTVPATGFS